MIHTTRLVVIRDEANLPERYRAKCLAPGCRWTGPWHHVARVADPPAALAAAKADGANHTTEKASPRIHPRGRQTQPEKRSRP